MHEFRLHRPASIDEAVAAYRAQDREAAEALLAGAMLRVHLR